MKPGSFTGRTHSPATRQRLSELARRPANVERLAANVKRWALEHSEEARARNVRAGFATFANPANVERLISSSKQWAADHPEEAHARNVRGGFATAHRFHTTKVNPRCPFCFPKEQQP